jgi:hypothetical protein
MDNNLLHKINDLFEYRGFPELYRISNINGKDAKVINDLLVNLQSKIYYLDTYLESNWKLNEKELKMLWNEIYKALGLFGISSKDHYDYCAQIHKYQRHEMDLRKNLLPIRLNTSFYYFYKSCDVKLMRRLLIEKLPSVGKLFNNADWRFFDLVTEVNDDAMDLEEDLLTINGNMVLISYNEFGRADTVDIFSKFLDECEEGSKTRFHGTASAYKNLIHKNTIQQVKATKKILKESKIMKTHNNAILYTHLNSIKP